VVIIKYLTSAIPYSYGGIKTTDGLYTVHKFTENSVFVASSTPIIGVKALIVGGGGGGGSRNGGGGGAGAYIYKEFIPVSKTQYNIVVGLGGTGVINGSMDYLNSALSGEDSSAFGFTAIGGGAGRGNVAGLIGGSGGGGGGLDNIGGTGTNGNSGGRGYSGNAWSGGGGGGSSGAGGNASANIGGIGGVGTPNNISGSLVTYSTGGIGGAYYGNVVGINGAYNTGNGGGGGGGEPNASGSGGSGIVIIKYLKSSITATSTNAIETTSTDGLYTILTYNQSGTFVVQ